MERLLQRVFQSKVLTWQSRTIQSYCGRFGNGVAMPGAECVGHLKNIQQLQQPRRTTSTDSMVSGLPPLLSILFSRLVKFGVQHNNAMYKAVPFGVEQFKTIHYDICLLQQRKIKVSLPNNPLSKCNIVGDTCTKDNTVGDVASDLPAYKLISILKRRAKKMKKHKYQKLRDRDLFKRRHILNIRARKKQAKAKKD